MKTRSVLRSRFPLLGVFLAVCASAGWQSLLAAPAVVHPQGAKILRVAVASFPPFAFQQDGRIQGLDIDLIRLVCAANGLEPRFDEVSFAEALERVERGEADVAAGAFYRTDERAKLVAFSAPYVRTGLVAVARADGPDLGNAVRIGVKRGATGEEYAKTRWAGDAGRTIVVFPSTEASFEALAAGSVDVILNDYLNSVQIISERYPGAMAIVQRWGSPNLLTSAELAFPLNPHRPEVKAAFDATLREISRGGTLDRLRNAWLHAPLPTDWWRISVIVGLALLLLAGVFGVVALVVVQRERSRTLDEYLRLVEELPEAVLVTVGGRVRRANRAARSLFAVDDLDALAAPALRVLRASDDEDSRAAEREIAVTRDDGTTRWVMPRSVDVRLGSIAARQWVLRDVTEVRAAREQLEDAFRAQGELLLFQERMVETSATWISVVDRTLRVMLWNRAAEAISGRARDSVLGGDAVWTESVPGPEDRARLMAAIAAVGAGEVAGGPVRIRLVRPDGASRSVAFFLTAMGDEVGGRVVMVGLDETALDQLWEQLLQSQKLESVGRLAAGVAHEFNNLLQVIIGQSELLRLRLPQDAGAELDPIMHSAGEGAELARQLLAFGRRQPMARRPVDIDAAVEDAQRLVRPLVGERIELVVKCAAGSFAQVDPTQLRQVLLNLASNARDAMPEGGVLDISTWSESEGSSGGSWVSIRVRDTGVGMSPEVMANVFEPFFTTKAVGSGSGLGLATVYGIVTQHGGTVDVDSAPGSGSTFTIRLPACERPDQPSATAVSAPSRAMAGVAVLVEDDPGVRAVLSQYVAGLGLEVKAAAGAAEARALAIDECPAVLVCDVRLGDGRGEDVAAELRKRFPALPVCFVTGFGDPDDLVAAAGTGPTTVLTKPCSLDELAAAIAGLLEHRR